MEDLTEPTPSNIERMILSRTPSGTALRLPDSARSSVLSNTDILSAVFEHFCVPTDRVFLYKAAVTCKAFKEPVLDRLWETLPSLFPLLKLLPSFQLRNGHWVSIATSI